MRTGSGLVRPRWRPAATGFEEVQPLMLAVPAFGQVEGELPAAVAGGAVLDADRQRRFFI